MLARALVTRAGSAAKATGNSCARCIITRNAKAMSCSRRSCQLSTEANSIKELPDDEPDDVVFESRYGLRTILLNRPRKLNSLNASMIRKIVPRLVQWEKSDMANVIVVKGFGDKAMCAGGDVAVLARQNQEGPEGWKKSTDYFALEYKLDHFIATYRKPFVAFMDGITMGGGVGLSAHAPFRIATERTVFSMPETTIGFFPDVGASFFLPRLNGSIGTYLALTSDQLTGPNVFYAGIATHFLHSTSLPSLENRLAELRFHDGDSLPKRLETINNTLEEFATGLPFDQPIQLAGEVRRAIDRCFSKDNVEDVVAALREEPEETREWTQAQIKTLEKRSPTAVRVALKQMHVGGKWDIAETFMREHQIASKFMRHPDFTEGVTALLIERREPQWKPRWDEAVSSANDPANFFEYDPAARLKLFSNRTYREYPFAKFGVPTEKEIRKMLASKECTPAALETAVVASRQGRQGIATVVQEIMSRKTWEDSDGKARWVNDQEADASKL